MLVLIISDIINMTSIITIITITIIINDPLQPALRRGGREQAVRVHRLGLRHPPLSLFLSLSLYVCIYIYIYIHIIYTYIYIYM